MGTRNLLENNRGHVQSLQHETQESNQMTKSSEDVLFWSVSCTGQRFVTRVNPRLSWLDRAGDQEDGVLPRIVLSVSDK